MRTLPRHDPPASDGLARIRSIVMLLQYAERETRDLSAVAALHISRAVEELAQVHFDESLDGTSS